MSTTEPTEKLQRAFRVRLRPLEDRPETHLAMITGEELVGIEPGGWYESTEITLWWDADKAPERFSEAEQRELARRAKKIERLNFNTPAEQDFDVEVLELVREQLVTPKPRKR